MDQRRVAAAAVDQLLQIRRRLCWQPPLHHTSTSIEVAGAQRRAGRRQAVVVERLADPIAPRALCRSSTPFGAGSTASNRRRFLYVSGFFSGGGGAPPCRIMR